MNKIVAAIAFFLYAAAIGAVEYELRLGHGAAPDNPRHIVAKEFAEAVKERTGGRVEIEIHHSESLGSDRQMAEALMLGTLDMSINSQGPMAAYNDKLDVIGLPFLFSSTEHIHRVLDGDIGKEIAKAFEKKNFKILAYWDNGFRHITNNKKPITEAEDLAGLVVRTPDDKITMALFEAFDAEPVPFAFGKLYDALEQGQFDGQENSLPNIFYSKLYEIQKYLSLTSHKYECCPLAISMRTWRRLPKDIQDIVQDEAVKFAIKHREMNNRLTEEILETLKREEIEINTADTDDMREKSKSVYSRFEKKIGKDLIDRVIAAGK